MIRKLIVLVSIYMYFLFIYIFIRFSGEGSGGLDGGLNNSQCAKTLTNGQELIQSDHIPRPQNQKRKSICIYINIRIDEFMNDTHGKPNEQFSLKIGTFRFSSSIT